MRRRASPKTLRERGRQIGALLDKIPSEWTPEDQLHIILLLGWLEQIILDELMQLDD